MDLLPSKTCTYGLCGCDSVFGVFALFFQTFYNMNIHTQVIQFIIILCKAMLIDYRLYVIIQCRMLVCQVQ